MLLTGCKYPTCRSYDEDQVALVVRDDSCFISRCPVVLGTPTINWGDPGDERI